MFKQYLRILLIIVTTNVFADTTWSDQTQPLDAKKVDEILNQDQNSSFWKLNLINSDQKDRYLFKSNLLVLSMQIGMSKGDETVSNKNGSRSANLDLKEVKLVLGKDFTLWHDEFHQYSRLFIAYSYTASQDNISYTTISLGLLERMRYYTFYKTKNWDFYPKISAEAGTSKLERDSYNIDGFTMEAGAGIVAQYRHNYECSLDMAYKTTRWQYPIDGIEDKFNGFYIGIGFSYRIMYGDF